MNAGPPHGDGWFEVGLARYRDFYLVRPQGRFADRLLSLALADNLVWRWSGPPSADSFGMALQAPGSEHFAIVRSDGAVVGHAAMYGHNMTHRTAFFEASLVHGPHGAGAWGVGAVALAMWFSLNRHDVRKLYLETTELRLAQFSSLVRKETFQVEGRLTEHVFAGGRYQDALILGASAAALREHLEDKWAQGFEVKSLSRV